MTSYEGSKYLTSNVSGSEATGSSGSIHQVWTEGSVRANASITQELQGKILFSRVSRPSRDQSARRNFDQLNENRQRKQLHHILELESYLIKSAPPEDYMLCERTPAVS